MEEVEVGSSVQITEPTLKPAAVSKWKVNDEEVTFPYTIAIGEGEGDLEIIFTHD